MAWLAFVLPTTAVLTLTAAYALGVLLGHARRGE